ncbi:MAG: hypothetical protein JXB29_08340, partial [Sedimentisphaerales bacterium]|nr:hypothetical protein [Sedimentisphaerales bacterium]
ILLQISLDFPSYSYIIGLYFRVYLIYRKKDGDDEEEGHAFMFCFWFQLYDWSVRKEIVFERD